MSKPVSSGPPGATAGWFLLALGIASLLIGIAIGQVGAAVVGLTVGGLGVTLLIAAKMGPPAAPAPPERVSDGGFPVLPPEQPFVGVDPPKRKAHHQPTPPTGTPTEPWATPNRSQKIVGELDIARSDVRMLFQRHGIAAERLAAGNCQISDAVVWLVADPAKPRDPNAIAAWMDGIHVGYLPHEVAALYAAAFQSLAERGRVLAVPGSAWGGEGDGQLHFNVNVLMPPPDGVQPFNELPDSPHLVLPRGRVIQVTGEEQHMEYLARFMGDRERHLAVTLHIVEDGEPRNKRIVEVRLMGEKIGTLTTGMSDQMRDLVVFANEHSRVAVAHATLKGSSLRAEVTVHAARSHEVSQSWLDGVTPGNVA